VIFLSVRGDPKVVMKVHEPKSTSGGSKPRPPKSWHAVSILPKGASCEAAHSLRGKRFLSAEAPRLPLAQCTNSKSCICAYKHHEDRRGQPRRSDETTGSRRNAKVTEERRSSGDRRKSDLQD
jgi:hypothetical protein